MRKIRAVVVHHTAGLPCETVEDLRRYHIRQGFRDVGYHYVITPEGDVFAGRPLARVGAHTKGYNADTVGIAVIGNYDQTKPSDAALQALEGLILYLAERFKGLEVYGHGELRNTRCPGRHLLEWLQRWRITNSATPRQYRDKAD